MKRMAFWITSITVVMFILFIGAFVSAGGMQMVTKPTLPDPELPLSLSSDLSYFRAVVLANEVGVTKKQMSRFTQLVDNAKAPENVDDLTLIASRSLATFDNAHTTLLAPLMYRLPVRLHWTSDALIVVKTRPEHADLLGRRILALGGKTPEELLVQVPQLVGGGTQSWVRYRSEYLYSAPSALALFGAEVQDGSVELRALSPEGVEETLILSADTEPMPGDPFWDFLDAFPGDAHFATKGWVTLLRPDQSLPIYLQETERVYLLRDLAEYRAIYVRMNGSINDDNETVKQFTQRVLTQVDQSQPRNIVVDFRYNRGGDYTTVLPLVRGLSKALSSDGKLYLITGPNTFSAGLMAGSQFKRYIPDQLTIVGGEVGDTLRFKAEGFSATLPASQVQVYITTAWGDIANDCGWFDDCFLPNKLLLRGIGSLDPDIRVTNTWESYRGGEDLVLEAIFTDIRRRSQH